MKRLGMVLGAFVLVAAGAALAYGAIAVNPPGVTLTGCLSKNGDLERLAIGGDPAKRCGKNDRQVSLGNGDITGVVAGTGLNGGAESGGATLAVDPSYIRAQQIAAGDSRCSAGGVAILIGLSQPALVCNGTPGKDGKDGKDGADGSQGAGSLKSANGLYTITVSNSGIVLRGPNGRVVVDGAGARVITIGGQG